MIVINGGDLLVKQSYEGIESRVIAINGGNIHITASDDGLNVAGGNDGSASHHFPGGQEESSEDYVLQINDGYVYVNSTGDGLDANGKIQMTGGTVVINGPTTDNNGALDYDISFSISGGILIGAGSSRMAQAPGSASSQSSVLIYFNKSISGGKMVHLEDSDGNNILSFVPVKYFGSLVFSSPDLEKGEHYYVYTEGSDSGYESDGLYTGGTYSGGTEYTDFTLNGTTMVIQ
jgi:hypothetical protein